MMQDRCNGFSGQALHHLNASESVPTIASPALVAFYTARGSLGACVSCQRLWGRMGEGRGCDWWREKRSDSRRITFEDGSRDSSCETRLFDLRRAQVQGWIGVLSAGGNYETCQAAFGYLSGACCIFIFLTSSRLGPLSGTRSARSLIPQTFVSPLLRPASRLPYSGHGKHLLSRL